MKDNNLKHPCSIPEALKRFEKSDKTAIICGNDKISYKELIADAKKVANVLIAQGVNNGDRVVLNMSRTIDYIRIFLGIIFSGGIVVTIHSGWPEQQQNHVISDCSPVLIINDNTSQELLSAQLSIEELNKSLPEIKGEDPFQIVYTSGSTGIPKGTVNCHQFLINNCLLKDESDNNQSLRYFVNNCHCVLFDANLAFIAATLHLFMALMNEKKLALATDNELTTPKGLAECIRKSNADEMGGILSRYYKYLEEPEFYDAMKGVRHIYLTGEAPIPKIMDTFCEYPNLVVYHGYGSSETGGIFCKLYQKGDEIVYDPASSMSPIYILDEDNKEVLSAGSVGEICVGGVVGKHGYYWNNPELTSEKYVEHPIYGRLFHLGDMARIEPDGNLKIVGRLDGMAKLHGQRIELGAIEKAIEDFPGVRRAAVKIQGEGSEAVLCGYYSGKVDEGSLRRSLAESLPYYMVPALLRKLPELPLNLNGKIDRRALPLIPSKTGQYAPPKTEKEKILCDIFANVLKLQKPVSIDDSFFELGGNSIRGMAVSALLKIQGFEMKMEWLFAVPTIRLLAPMLIPSKVEDNKDETLWSAELNDAEREEINEVVGLDNVESVYPLFGETKHLVKMGDPIQVVDMFLISEDITEDEIRKRLISSVRCHQVMRSIFLRQDTERPLQVVLKDRKIPVFYVDLSRLAVQNNNGNILSNAQIQYLNNLKHLLQEKKLSLSKMIFEVGLVRISKNSSVLVLAYSHLLLDGAGKYSIVNELACGVPAKSDVLQYNRYIHFLQSDSYKEESRKIWQKSIAGRPLLTEFPYSNRMGKGNTIRQFVVGNAFAEKAAQYCLDMHVTPSAFACMALGKTLIELCDTDEVCFLSTNSGRNSENGELTGMFAAGIPIYVKKRDTLANIQEQLLCSLKRPIPDLDELPLGFDNPNSGVHINLSMQTYLKSPKTPELELPFIPSMAKLRNNAPINNSTPSKILTFMVTPEPSFSFEIIYDNRVVGVDLVNRLGRRFLSELRHLVEVSI